MKEYSVTVSRIASYFGMTGRMLVRRHRGDAWALHVAAWAFVRVLGLSSVRTGRLLGRDHSTVLTAIRRVETRASSDAEAAADLRAVAALVESSASRAPCGRCGDQPHDSEHRAAVYAIAGMLAADPDPAGIRGLLEDVLRESGFGFLVERFRAAAADAFPALQEVRNDRP